ERTAIEDVVELSKSGRCNSCNQHECDKDSEKSPRMSVEHAAYILIAKALRAVEPSNFSGLHCRGSTSPVWPVVRGKEPLGSHLSCFYASVCDKCSSRSRNSSKRAVTAASSENSRASR